MKAYFSALIDKSIPSENSKLSKNLIKDLKKLLKTPKSNINLKEHNAFIFLYADKTIEKPFDPKIIEEIQNKLYLRLQEYYVKNKSRLQKHLKGMRELKETSQIVKNFLKEIDPKLPKVFDLRLKKQISELPAKFCDLQISSVTAIWSLSEEQKVQFYLSGCPAQVFKVVHMTDGKISGIENNPLFGEEQKR